METYFTNNIKILQFAFTQNDYYGRDRILQTINSNRTSTETVRTFKQ